MHYDTADAGAGQVGERGGCVRGRGHDRDAALAQPRERAFDLLARSLKLDRDQPHLFRDARAADVEHQVELLDEVVQQRLADERLGVGQVVALAEAFHLLTSFCRRSLRHCSHPIHRLVDRYLSPKSGNTVTTHPSRSPRATRIDATNAAPHDWPTSTPSICPSA